jgi:hypothetical protein
MKTYKVWIQIEEIDEAEGHHRNIGSPYEAGKFATEKAANRFVENELMAGRLINTRLHQACRQVLDSLDVGGEQSRQFAEEIRILKNALKATPQVNDSCPKCGAGSDEREFQRRDFVDAEAVHVRYLCKKCGSEIIEEFTLTDVFIDE